MAALHDEVVVTVTGVNEWGYHVELADGTAGFIDKTKTLVWAQAHTAPPAPGDRLVAAVLDDERSPCRLSELPSDIDIARTLR